MPLAWIRYDTNLPWNPKILALIAAGKYRAALVYDYAMAYSGGHDTDGYIPTLALPVIHGKPKDAADLVQVGLWDADRAGWFIPDYADYQQTSGKTAEVRIQKQVASRKGNCIRWHGKACDCWREAS